MKPRPLSSTTAGNVLLIVLLAMLVLFSLIAFASRIALTDMRSQNSSGKLNQAYYAAEGGLNLRADAVRSAFLGYNRPTGVGPNSANPCTGSNTGSGELACRTTRIGTRSVSTYVQDITSPPTGEVGTVSAGERFEGLSYIQYVYRIHSDASGNAPDSRESSVELVMQSRLVPLFQFMSFYNRDLEIHPGPNMTLNGRIHTNGDLYLNANNTLTINGGVSAKGMVTHRGKDGRPCSGTVKIFSVAVPCGTDYRNPSQATGFNGKLLPGQNALEVPGMSSLAPVVGNESWDKADVRIVAQRLTAAVQPSSTCLSSSSADTCYVPGTYSFKVERADGVTDAAATNTLNAKGILSQSKWWDNREGRFYDLFNVDSVKLLSNITSLSGGRPLNDMTDGGLVLHLSVDDGNAATNGAALALRNYAFRMGSAAAQTRKLADSTGNQPRGLTVISNQPVYTWGDYNRDSKVPASIMADAVNMLSNSAPVNMLKSLSGSSATYGPAASSTTVNAAFLSGVDDTVSGSYNGGLQNYPRLHEDWNPSTGTATLTYRGSFVSLGNSLHVSGPQNKTRYNPPVRDWNFDSDFLNVDKLPPLSPRFVYLRQLSFTRDY